MLRGRSQLIDMFVMDDIDAVAGRDAGETAWPKAALIKAAETQRRATDSVYLFQNTENPPSKVQLRTIYQHKAASDTSLIQQMQKQSALKPKPTSANVGAASVDPKLILDRFEATHPEVEVDLCDNVDDDDCMFRFDDHAELSKSASKFSSSTSTNKSGEADQVIAQLLEEDALIEFDFDTCKQTTFTPLAEQRDYKSSSPIQTKKHARSENKSSSENESSSGVGDSLEEAQMQRIVRKNRFGL